MEEGDGVGDRRAGGSPAAADGGQAAMPLTPDAHSTGSGFWLELEAGSHLGKSATRSSCVGALLYSYPSCRRHSWSCSTSEETEAQTSDLTRPRSCSQ